MTATRLRQPELAARDNDRRTADLDLVLRARVRVERRRPVDLRALVDLDLLPELRPAVPREMERDRPGGRAGRRDPRERRAPGRRRAPSTRRRRARCTRCRTATAPRARRSRDEAPQPPPATRARRRRAAAPGGRARPASTAVDAEQREQRVGVRVRLVGERRLRHPAERDPRAVALEPHRHDSRAALEPDLLELERPGEDERRAEDRMPGERQLERRREDPDPDVPFGRRRVDEDRLAELHLARERLQLLLGDLARVGEDGDLVPRERDVGEDVGNDVAEGRHAPSEPQENVADTTYRRRRHAEASVHPSSGDGRLTHRVVRCARRHELRRDHVAVPKNSVGTAQLKNNAVTTAKIKNGAITAAKISDFALGAVEGRRRGRSACVSGRHGSTAVPGDEGVVVLQGSVGDRPPPGEHQATSSGLGQPARSSTLPAGYRPAGNLYVHRVRRLRHRRVHQDPESPVP